MHPVTNVLGQRTLFAPFIGGNFHGVDISEYYKLAWTAYAISMEDFNTTSKMGNLYLYYDYQPWSTPGEAFRTNGKRALLMKNVSTFRFTSIGSIMKIQVCTKSNLIEDEKYSICKEKTIF